MVVSTPGRHAPVVVLLGLLAAACASLGPPAPASPTAWPRVPEDDNDELPPIARLVLADGSAHAGVLGSFAYRETYADAPWIGAGLDRIQSPHGRQPLTVGLLPGNTFSGWSASYAAADDTAGDLILPLSSGSGQQLERAQFEPPPAGDWVIQVRLTFPGDDGDAAYYWHLVVP